ncbi:amino acid permease [Kineosporia sp. NBRC 101731]|uniref:amino acid permease n=1 Tax=Kineosporia sp. NBRC 101731 TaxID=3032199 RepID=UPI0024A54147|nr:amino acid permease [Kineosporia sp. NBRC 101731]GLY33685.1 amino acid transporter [Kineosporia sp. NBRC 101731]
MSDSTPSDDESVLASLGYKQELHRSWSGFSNFAISFSIISILAGCFTTFGQAWNNGGPIAISLGWPVISAFILIIGLCMAELVSAYPTSGGIYWWAAKLGGAKAGYYTGWLNLVGLVAILASVAYGAAIYLNTFIDLFSDGYATGFLGGNYLYQQFFWFAALMLLITAVNIFSSHLLAVINNVSVWWHVFGALIVVLVLVFGPDSHQSLSFVFTERINNAGIGGDGDVTFWFYVLPLGFLLTQYTITGYDASAHLSEETQGAANAAAKGIWQSILYSAIGGWILLLAFLFAATETDVINSFDPEVNPYGGGSVLSVLATSLSPALFKLVVFISMSGQIYCSTACMTSTSRMLFAFSRDRAVPGSGLWSKVDAKGVPRNAVLAGAGAAVVLTLPALYESPSGAPTAFYAVVSIGVIGLYLAFAIPIYLRWKAGDGWQPGPWTLGSKYRWMSLLAVAEIAVTSVYFVLPFSPDGWPGDGFTWTAVNYAPIVLVALLLALFIGWHVSVKHWFTGPRSNVDLPDRKIEAPAVTETDV